VNEEESDWVGGRLPLASANQPAAAWWACPQPAAAWWGASAAAREL
jgi:hypothetical protein